ncbi:hypothetical protein GCM10023163_28770 [Aestuariibaculum suncheonense]
MLASPCLIAQGLPELPSIIQPTPAVAELGKYGTYPVSMNTGIPNISFPLFEVNVAEISLPFSLSYHAGGIKVNQEATEVGLGWSISGNMIIHRNVLGTPDEMPEGNFNMAVMDFDEFYAKVSQGGYSEIEENYYDLKASADGAGRDTRPDMFNYNLPGKSGQFMYASDRTYMTFPYEPIKILRNTMGSNYAFSIIDEKGIEYRFRDINKILIDDSPQPRNNYITDWYVTEIVSRTKKDTVYFEYETCGYVKEQKSYYQMMESNASGLEEESYSIVGQEEMRLKRISYRLGEVIFNYNTQRLDRTQSSAKSLDNIRVYDLNDKLVKGFDFSYDYFTANFGLSGYPDSDTKRLKLLSFSETSAAGSDMYKKYEFDYESNISIPRKGEFSQDLWGYFNGKLNFSLIPSKSVQGNDFYLSDLYGTTYCCQNPTTAEQNTTYNIGSANRAVDTSKVRMCILKKITYPTKGYTTFKFESNCYTSELVGTPTVVYGAGLRIANIKNYDFDGALESFEEYKYGVSENGLGEKLFNEDLLFKDYDDYTQEFWEGEMPYTGGCTGRASSWHRKYMGLEVYSALNYNGGNLIYPEVNHYQGTDLSNLSKTKYEYNLVSESILDAPAVYEPKRYLNSGNYANLCHNWTDSQLVKKTSYSKSGGVYTPIYLEEFIYNEIYSKTDYGLLFKELQKYIEATCIRTPGSGGSPYYFIANEFLYKSRAYRMTEKKETSYLPTTSEALVQTTTMSYDNTDHMQMTVSTTTSSDGKTLVNKMYYPDDITSASYLLGGTLTTLQNNAINRLNSDGDIHNVVVPIQREVYQDDNSNGAGDASELISLQRTNFKDWGGSVVLPEEISTLKGVYNSSSNPLQSRIYYHDYDDKGNPIEVSTASGIHIYYIWGYNNQYPVAKIENFTSAQASNVQSLINAVVSASDSDDSQADEDLLRTALSNLRDSSYLSGAMLSTYTYDPLVGMTSMTDPKGYTTYYLYDAFNRLQFVKDDSGKVLSENEYHYKGQ